MNRSLPEWTKTCLQLCNACGNWKGVPSILQKRMGTRHNRLKDYEIVENTQIVLLPGTIIRINGNSSDFTASFFGFPKEMFREACLRFEPIFFRFIKEKPCYTLKDESTEQSTVNACHNSYIQRS